jgi:hypothetical protein
MSGFAITVQSDDLTRLAHLSDQLAGAASYTELLNRAGEVLQETVRAHFEELANDAIHHESSESLGAARTGFYEEAAGKVQSFQIESGAVSVSVEHEGLAQRYFGGDIHAKEGGFLTIPARAETYCHRAREFENLQLVIFAGGESGMLVAKDGGAKHLGRGKRTLPTMDAQGSDVFFWLVRSVHQEPDPTVLPDGDEILDAAVAACGDYIAAVARGI